MSPFSLATPPATRRRSASSIGLAALLLLSSVAAPANAFAAPAAPPNQYHISAWLDVDAAFIRADQTVRFTNRTSQPLETLVFHSVAGWAGRLSLESTEVDGVPVAPRLDASGSVIELPLPSPLDPGRTTEARLVWSEQVPRTPDRFSAVGGTISLGNWFPTLAVHRGDWDRRPYTEVGDAFFTETADFDVQLDLSREASVAFTGDLVRQDGAHWEMAASAVRDFALAVSTGYSTAEAFVEAGPRIEVYALHPERAQLYAEAARELVTAFSSLVGPYPYPTFRIAETPLPASYAGMEYPRIVFLSSELSTQDFPRSTARYVLAHEIAHQWFYGLVGDDQLADPWLDEAFATHLALLAYERVAPERAAAEAGARQAPAGPGAPIDQGVFDFRSDPPYFDVVYRRGSRFLSELRQAIGLPGWEGFLHALYGTYLGKVATPRAVLDAAQQSAPGVNLNPLVARYTRYGAFTYPDPRPWSLDVPPGPWSGQLTVSVSASFPVASVELWLDDWALAGGSTAGPYTVDVSPVPADEYVLLARVTDDQGALFERATRVRVLP